MFYSLQNSGKLGKNIIYLPHCHSTNEEAKRLTQNSDIPSGTIVITDEQLAGKGQRGNTWYTEPHKNITCSIVFREPYTEVQINQIVALGLHNLVSHVLTDYEVRIKWPNDLLVDKKKICGILIEKLHKGSENPLWIVGIGLNVNQIDFKYLNATSLSIATGQTYHLADILEQMALCLEQIITANFDYQTLKRRYLENLLGYQSKRVYKSSDEIFEATVVDIDAAGKLVLQTPAGVRVFEKKEITWLY